MVSKVGNNVRYSCTNNLFRVQCERGHLKALREESDEIQSPKRIMNTDVRMRKEHSPSVP